jgi:hypothetical protein
MYVCVYIICIVCLNFKFPPPVEVCWQIKNTYFLIVDCYNQSWQYDYFINMIRKQHNLLDAKIKNALVKCFEEIKG